MDNIVDQIVELYFYLTKKHGHEEGCKRWRQHCQRNPLVDQAAFDEALEKVETEGRQDADAAE